MKPFVQSLSVRSVLAWLVAAGAASAAAAASSSDLVKLSGRDHGLCVLIGCGGEKSPALAAELASSGAMLVHGIALDDAALARARKAIRAKGVDGLATVERLALKPLPYRDNLANLVVVEDAAAAAAAGLAPKEALRVLAPGGKLCVCRKGKWTVTVKPWPKEMDEWTHESRGPDGNCVSKDTIVKFPVGFRWHAGLPMNLRHPKRTANAWSSTRGMALAKGRCFALSTSVLENVGPTYDSPHGLDQYVTARDAFNGLLLWRRKLGRTYYGGLFYPNRAPFAAVGDRVYVAPEEGRLVALDAATGEVARTFQTAYHPGVILVDRGVAVTATWKDGARVGGLHGVDRRRMTFGLAEGTVEAFDASSGKRLWLLDKLATSIRSADGTVYLLARKGPDKREELGGRRRKGQPPVPPRPAQSVVAVDLRGGKVLWEVKSDVLGTADPLRLDAAGLGVVTVCHNNGAKTTALSAEDGKVLFQVKANSYTAFYKGEIQLGGRKYDSRTGKPTGRSAFSLGRTICTPRYFVNGILIANRGCGYQVHGKGVSYFGARGGCLFASIPAFGAFFAPQNWCRCAPSQIGGFISYGPIAHEPTPEEMQKPPPVEKGPAFGTLSGKAGAADWPMYRHDAERSNATKVRAPKQLDVLWRKTLCKPSPQGRVAANWREYLTGPLTAPVVAGGVMIAAATDQHQVVALDAASGAERWRQTVGGRVDTPPTVANGACLFGSHDGWVYALSCRDGRLAWRMRAAPSEERMVSYGQVESPWPVIGTVLVADGVAYASAGRTQGSDGGIVVRAFEPSSGKVLWSKAMAPTRNTRSMRVNDLMLKVGDSVQLMATRMDPRTGQIQTARKPAKGKPKPPPVIAPTIGLEGFACGNWTRLGNRKHIAMGFGKVRAEQVSWGENVVCANRAGKTIQAVGRDKAGGAAKKPDPKAPTWSAGLPAGYQATAVVICPNAVVVGGGVYPKESVRSRLKDAKSGQGFVRVLSMDKGQRVAERTFPAPLTYNGIAVANGRVYATFADGSAACLGGK